MSRVVAFRNRVEAADLSPKPLVSGQIEKKVDGAAHRRLRTDWRLQGCGFGRARRLDRLVVLAAVRFGRLLCRTAWDD
jgi:hypothetical protein